MSTDTTNPTSFLVIELDVPGLGRVILKPSVELNERFFGLTHLPDGSELPQGGVIGIGIDALRCFAEILSMCMTMPEEAVEADERYHRHYPSDTPAPVISLNELMDELLTFHKGLKSRRERVGADVPDSKLGYTPMEPRLVALAEELGRR